MHERHQQWLSDVNSIPILTIDTGIYDIYNKEHQQEIMEMITDFINKIDRMNRTKLNPKEE